MSPPGAGCSLDSRPAETCAAALFPEEPRHW